MILPHQGVRCLVNGHSAPLTKIAFLPHLLPRFRRFQAEQAALNESSCATPYASLEFVLRTAKVFIKAAATDTTRWHQLNMTSAELVDCNSLAPVPGSTWRQRAVITRSNAFAGMPFAFPGTRSIVRIPCRPGCTDRWTRKASWSSV